MADIFISYSRKDSSHALQLAERLRASGADVWMDSSALAAAETWSAEIVGAINSCGIFMVLLSPSAVASHNVNKEVSLASEKRKTIVPIVIEKCPLSEAMEYALAGLQHVKIWDEEGLERVFAKLGITGKGFSQTVPYNRSSKKKWPNGVRIAAFVIVSFLLLGSYFLFFNKAVSKQPYGFQIHKLAVLPFENLSTAEDEKLSDGITSEVIHTLAQLFGVSVTDRNTVMSYKGKKTSSRTAAKELDVEFIVNGTVQVSGTNIRVSAQLTNAETGATLLSEQFDGSLDDVLALQTRLGQAIGFELQYALVNNQRKAQRFPIPKDEQALALRIQAISILDTTKSPHDIEKAKALLLQALEREPNYIGGLSGLARCYQSRFRLVSHDPHDLSIADSILAVAMRTDSSAHYLHRTLFDNAELRNDTVRAEFEAKELVRLEPNDPYSYGTLSEYYQNRGRWNVVVDINTQLTRRDLSNFIAWQNLIVCCNVINDTAAQLRSVREFLPLLARYLSKNETDAKQRVLSAYYLALLAKHDETVQEIQKGLAYRDKWSGDEYFTSADAYALVGEWDKAIEMLARSIILDHENINVMEHDHDLAALLKQPQAESRVFARVEEIKQHQ